jgi:Mn2+/Fe2+ NRAMP family transporter
MVLVTVGLVLVQEMCSRLAAYTGQGLGWLLREQFPLRSTATALALLFVAHAGLTVSEFAGIGAASELLGRRGARLFGVGLLGASLLAAAVVPLSSAHTVA